MRKTVIFDFVEFVILKMECIDLGGIYIWDFKRHEAKRKEMNHIKGLKCFLW